MSRYTRIAALAASNSERFFAHRDHCTQVANLIIGRFAEYLEAPESALHFIELDSELKLTRTQTDSPKVEQGRDGYWYFGLQVHFADSKQRGFSDSFLKFGVKVDCTHCSVKLDTAFAVDLTKLETLDPVFEDIVQSYEAYYSAAPSALPRSIGFFLPVE